MIALPDLDRRTANLKAALWVLGCFVTALFLIIIMLTQGLVNHREEIDALTRRIEALEKEIKR